MANPSPSTPVSSIPLNLAGFLARNTIHVEGDAGNLHFSGHFDVHQSHTSNTQTITVDNPDINGTPRTQSFSTISSLFSSMAPHQTTHEDEDKDPSTHLNNTPEFSEFCDLAVHDDQILAIERNGYGVMSSVVTRLRSGVISRVSYFQRGRKHCFAGDLTEDVRREDSCLLVRRPKERRERRSEREEVLERVLRRHSFPVRPCSSYSFFVMTKWDLAKSSSFEETSKRLGQMWTNLSQEEKKIFVEMASKDKARYKKQCLLLRSR